MDIDNAIKYLEHVRSWVFLRREFKIDPQFPEAFTPLGRCKAQDNRFIIEEGFSQITSYALLHD